MHDRDQMTSTVHLPADDWPELKISGLGLISGRCVDTNVYAAGTVLEPT